MSISSTGSKAWRWFVSPRAAAVAAGDCLAGRFRNADAIAKPITLEAWNIRIGCGVSRGHGGVFPIA